MFKKVTSIEMVGTPRSYMYIRYFAVY